MIIFEKLRNNIEVFLLSLIVIMNLSALVYFVTPSFTGNVVDARMLSPSNFVFEDKIDADSEKVVIHIDNAMLSRYEDSGSMSPLLSEDATGISIKPSSADEINVGDVISFRDEDSLIVHRVVEKAEDDRGVYFITQGDNNLVKDGKVYFDEIDSVLVGIIY